MLELSCDYFRPGFYYKRALWRGLIAANMRAATNITIPWQHFMRGKLSLNKTLKERYISIAKNRTKDSGNQGLNPYKYASAYVNVGQFESIINHFMDELQSKYGTVF